MERLYTVPEIAERFGVTNQTVRNWIASGLLAGVQATPRGRFRITASALEAFERGARGGGANAVGPGAGAGAGAGTNPQTGPVAVELARIVGAIVAAVEPESVFLFGSRGRGEGGAASDIDLAIIAPDGVQRRRLAMRAYEAIARVDGRTVAVDIVVLTPSIVKSERDLPGSVTRAIVADGVSVYGSRTLT